MQLACLALAAAVALAATPARADHFPVKGRPMKTASLFVGSSGQGPASAPGAPAPQFTPAPVPDPDLSAPQTLQQNPQAELVPGFYRGPDYFYRGEGFMPGSTMQGEQNKHVSPTPGLNLRLPLQ